MWWRSESKGCAAHFGTFGPKPPCCSVDAPVVKQSSAAEPAAGCRPGMRSAPATSKNTTNCPRQTGRTRRRCSCLSVKALLLPQAGRQAAVRGCYADGSGLCPGLEPGTNRGPRKPPPHAACHMSPRSVAELSAIISRPLARLVATAASPPRLGPLLWLPTNAAARLTHSGSRGAL